MSAFAGYAVADGEHRATGGPRGKGDEQEGSDREGDRRGADVDCQVTVHEFPEGGVGISSLCARDFAHLSPHARRARRRMRRRPTLVKAFWQQAELF